MIAPLPPTTTLADVLLMHGTAGALTPPLRSMCPPQRALCGRAVTVQMAPGAVDGGFDPLYALLSEDLDDCVLVVAGMGGVAGAVWGQILSRAARRRGALAALVDGAVRDVSVLDAERLAVWAASEHTAGAPGQAHVVATRATVRVGDVSIDDQDLVVADTAGAVRLPAAQAEMLLGCARELAAAEERVLEDLASGLRLNDAYHHKKTAQTAIRSTLQSNGTRPRL
jgi:4-hydroxy-4-methyl-2-oxoglutarate aldolase